MKELYSIEKSHTEYAFASGFLSNLRFFLFVHAACSFGIGHLVPAILKKKKKEHLNYYTIKSRGISVAKCK